MKVAFDLKNCFLYGRGITNFMINFLNDYKNVFYGLNESFILSPDFDFINSTNKHVFDSFIKLPTPFINKYSKVSKLFYDQYYFKNTVERLKPDLLFSPYFDIPYFYNGSIITSIHDLSILLLKSSYSYFFYKYYETLLRKSVKQSSKILTVSEFSKNDILNHFPTLHDEDIIVIYNKSSNSIINYSKNQISYTQKYIDKYELYNLPKNFILYTGGFEKRKNISLLINGYLKALQNNSSVPPMVFTGVNEKSISDFGLLNYNNKYLIFLDYVPDEILPLLYKNADLVVNTSQYEGFGIPILDALTMKRPILCSNLPVYNEIASDLPIYFKNNDIQDFTDKLSLFYSGKIPYPELDKYYLRSVFFNFKTYKEEIINLFNTNL